MTASNKILDMTPLGMKFTVLKNSAQTNGNSLDLHWELLPGCNMKDSLVHHHPNAIETYSWTPSPKKIFYLKSNIKIGCPVLLKWGRTTILLIAILSTHYKI